MIATGYLPYMFSENLCNGKLVYALTENNHNVKVISRVDPGFTYSSDWSEPWIKLKTDSITIEYPLGNKLSRLLDAVYSSIVMNGYRDGGIRWVRRAYQMALKMIKEENFDAIITRSPNDIAHLIGYKLKKKTGIKWIANWNDPASPIWPGKYKHNYSPQVQEKKMLETEKLLKAADINTFPSDSLRKHFIEFFPFLKNHKTEVIPHIGLEESIWPPSAEPFTDGKLRFLHSGNLSAERDPETTFMALRKLIDEDGFENFEFHIMGNVNDYTDSLIEKYNLKNYVKCIGSFSYMQALSKMQSYDVLVMIEAKLEKGIFFASKFVDYLQTGLPVFAISPKDGFASDNLTNQEGQYLADNTDVNSIYKELKKIVKSFSNGTLKDCNSEELFKNFSSNSVVKKITGLVSDNIQND